MANELTLEILEHAREQLPPMPIPKQVRISRGDYRKMREASDIFHICPEQVGGWTPGFMGEKIIPDESLLDGSYEVDF